MLITTKLCYAIIFIMNLAQEYYTLQSNTLKKISYNNQSLLERYFSKLKKKMLRDYFHKKFTNLITLSLVFNIIENTQITRCRKSNNIEYLSNNHRNFTYNLFYNSVKYLNNILGIFNNNLKTSTILNSKTNQYIYADYNATSTILPIVKDQLDNLSSLNIYNPSSTHKLGQNTKSIIEKTREIAINQLNAKDHDVIFTSSGTEANNLVMNSTTDYQQLISSTEHLSIINCATNAELIPVDYNGIVRLDVLNDLLHKFKNKKILVSIMTANNETGVIQPIKEIVKMSHKFGAVVHTDAIQACGKIHINIEDLGVDLLTISSHKLGSIAGTGVLFFNSKKIKIKPMILGGYQERGLRAGTENVISIYLLSISLNHLKDSIKKMSAIKKLRDKLEDDILNLVPDAQIFSKDTERLPNTTCISMPNVSKEIQMINFDINNIAVSNGSACSSGALKHSHVLSAMGIDDNIAKNSIRISLGPNFTVNHIKKIVDCWHKVYLNNQMLNIN